MIADLSECLPYKKTKEELSLLKKTNKTSTQRNPYITRDYTIASPLFFMGTSLRTSSSVHIMAKDGYDRGAMAPPTIFFTSFSIYLKNNICILLFYLY